MAKYILFKIEDPSKVLISYNTYEHEEYGILSIEDLPIVLLTFPCGYTKNMDGYFYSTFTDLGDCFLRTMLYPMAPQGSTLRNNTFPLTSFACVSHKQEHKPIYDKFHKNCVSKYKRRNREKREDENKYLEAVLLSNEIDELYDCISSMIFFFLSGNKVKEESGDKIISHLDKTELGLNGDYQMSGLMRDLSGDYWYVELYS